MARSSDALQARALEATDAPPDVDPVVLDVRTLGPPKPLTKTLERLTELPADGALVQVNDRAPQHLYARLDERGYTYNTTELDDAVVTVIWQE